MEELVRAFGPVLAAGFAIQQLLEILDPVIGRWISGTDKKAVLGIVAFVAGLGLAFGAGLTVLEPLGIHGAVLVDRIVTALLISAGSEGVNSFLKLLGYLRDRQRSESAMAARRAAAGGS